MSNMQPMRVLLVDDHPLFKEGLRNLLAARGIEVVGTARDGYEALDRARQLHPDVILMDIKMPRCDGLTATRLIKTEIPEVAIVMLTTSDDDDSLFEAIKSGASGYLLKSLDADRFFELLSGVAMGEPALSPELAARILGEFARPRNPSHPAAPAEGSPAICGAWYVLPRNRHSAVDLGAHHQIPHERNPAEATSAEQIAGHRLCIAHWPGDQQTRVGLTHVVILLPVLSYMASP
jgi:DNA-binding NarL/FixJ family response regulator